MSTTRPRDSTSFSAGQQGVRGEIDGLGKDESADQPLGYLLYRAMTTVRPYVLAELEPLGVGLPEVVCMRILAEAPGQSNASLARGANVSPQAMNLVVRTLQDMGVIARPAVAAAGRSIPAQLTAKGVALLHRVEEAMRVADDRLVAHLSPTERAHLKWLLHCLGSHAPLSHDVELPSSG